MNGATLLFGLGATKAGTSWLYRYLSAHPECHLRTIKELHFFDTIDDGNPARRQQVLEQQRARITGDGARAARRRADLDDWMQVTASGDEAAYLAYLQKGLTDQRLIADITPAYSLLSEGRLKRMASMASDVRFVYLMRDPVERLWSHVRMIARRQSDAQSGLSHRAGEILRDALSGGQNQITKRGDYRTILTRLAAALDPSRLFLGFFEDMFSDSGITRICGFLGLTPRPMRMEKRVHAGVELPMTDAQRADAFQYLRPQYDFVAARMGRVPAAWDTNRVRV